MRMRPCLALPLVLVVVLAAACRTPQWLAPSRPASPTLDAPPTKQPTPEDTSVTRSEEPTETPAAEPTDTRRPTATPTEPPAEPSLEVIAPNGGEVWLEGSSHTVAWRSAGVEEVDFEIASGGKPLGHLALGQDAASGQVTWEIRVGLISDFGVGRSDAMRVRVSSSDDPELYDENDEPFTVMCPRIQFEPGATSATATGTLEADGGSYRYVLGASAGQMMEIDVSPAHIEVDIWGASDGSSWQIPGGERRLTVEALPATQDYFVTLTHEGPEENVDYTFYVAIR